MLTKSAPPGRALVRLGDELPADRDQLRGWLATLRGEAEALRAQAAHINAVADDAEVLACRIERVLRSL